VKAISELVVRPEDVLDGEEIFVAKQPWTGFDIGALTLL